MPRFIANGALTIGYEMDPAPEYVLEAVMPRISRSVWITQGLSVSRILTPPKVIPANIDW